MDQTPLEMTSSDNTVVDQLLAEVARLRDDNHRLRLALEISETRRLDAEKCSATLLEQLAAITQKANISEPLGPSPFAGNELATSWPRSKALVPAPHLGPAPHPVENEAAVADTQHVGPDVVVLAQHQTDPPSNENSVVPHRDNTLTTGLPNLQNSCYINAILQALIHIPAFQRLFFVDDGSRQKMYNQKAALTNGFGDLIFSIMALQSTGKRDRHTAEGNVENRLFSLRTQFASMRPDLFGDNGQRDALNLLKEVIQQLHQELNTVSIKPPIEQQVPSVIPSGELSAAASRMWRDICYREKSTVFDMFMFQRLRVETCSSCKVSLSSFDTQSFLMLPVLTPESTALSSTAVVQIVVQLIRTSYPFMRMELSIDLKASVRDLRRTVVWELKTRGHIRSEQADSDTQFHISSLQVATVRVNHEAHTTAFLELVSSVNATSSATSDDLDRVTVADILGNRNVLVFSQLAHPASANLHRKKGKAKASWFATPTPTAYDLSFAYVDAQGKATPLEFNIPVRISFPDVSPTKTEVLEAVRAVIDRLLPEMRFPQRPRESFPRGQHTQVSIRYLTPEFRSVSHEDGAAALSTRILAILYTSQWFDIERDRDYFTTVVNYQPPVQRYRIEALLKTPPKRQPVNSTFTLEQSFLEYMKPQPVHGKVCSCGAKDTITILYSMWRFPRVLVLCLRRFEEDKRVPGRWTKLNQRCEFPATMYLVEPAAGEGAPHVHYELCSVVEHEGTCEAGHYTACCRTGSDTWHRFNDHIVDRIADSNAISKSRAYLLFYVVR